MRFRKLRLAWSVSWGLAAVLLVVLWVRSNRTLDAIQGPVLDPFINHIHSIHGRIYFFRVQPVPRWQVGKVTVSRMKLAHVHDDQCITGSDQVLSVGGPAGLLCAIPHWTLALIALLGVGMPWFRSRFSLRTLFIATTLVAVALGFVVYATRK